MKKDANYYKNLYKKQKQQNVADFNKYRNILKVLCKRDPLGRVLVSPGQLKEISDMTNLVESVDNLGNFVFSLGK